MITQARLHELFSYDANTGLFTRRITTSHNARAGSVVGVKHNQGYLTVCIANQGRKRQYLLHILAWVYVHGVYPRGDIDHINRVRSDNRISNLRVVTRRQNLHNTTVPKGKSGLIGASQRKSDGKWTSRIRVGDKRVFLGSFNTASEAHDAYIDAAKRFYGLTLLQQRDTCTNM